MENPSVPPLLCLQGIVICSSPERNLQDWAEDWGRAGLENLNRKGNELSTYTWKAVMEVILLVRHGAFYESELPHIFWNLGKVVS